MGFSEARAGRALLATRGGPATLETALSWIEEHEGDSDIDDPLTPEELATHKPAKKTPLSEEEAQRMAYELQKKLREVRAFLFFRVHAASQLTLRPAHTRGQNQMPCVVFCDRLLARMWGHLPVTVKSRRVSVIGAIAGLRSG